MKQQRCEVCGQTKVYTFNSQKDHGEWVCLQHAAHANIQKPLYAEFVHFTDLRELEETPEADRLYVADILYCPQRFDIRN